MRRILFPASIDEFGHRISLAERNAIITEDRAVTVDDLAYAVQALQKKLGVDGSLDAASVDALIATALALTVNGTANRIMASRVGQVITLSTPQDIHSGASPTFAGLALTGKVTTYNGVATAQMGVAPILEYVFLEAIDTDQSWASFVNTTAAGFYRVSVYYRLNTIDVGVSTVHLDIRWNGAVQSYTGETLTLSGTGVYKQYTLVLYHTGGANSVQYQADYTAISGSADSYDAHLVIERLT